MKPSRFILLQLISFCIVASLATAQGTIFGTVRNADMSVPDSTTFYLFGFINNSDAEIRSLGTIGTGYDAGNWFDDFQNYLSEAPGAPYDYYFFNSSNSEMYHLSKSIPSNSFQQEDIVLRAGNWPSLPEQIITIPIIDSGIVIIWPKQTGLTMHIYRRHGSSQGSFFRIDDSTGSLSNSGVADSFFVDTQVDRSSSYSYLLIAEDSTGVYSPPSKIISQTSACVALGSGDSDNDRIADLCDNCPDLPNPMQIDTNMNAIGDLCEGGCCQIRGNVNGLDDFGSPVGVADLTYLVNFLFKGGPAPPCLEEGNIDAIISVTDPIDVSDLTYLINYLFKAGPPPPACP